MKIGFTGTRKGLTDKQEQLFLDLIKAEKNITEFHHGDCVGADARVDELMRSISSRYQIIVHPPIQSNHRAWCNGDITLPEKDYIERNHDIVDVCDVLYACPGSMSEEQRSGTWATIRYARKQNKMIVIIYPTGEMSDATELG